MDAIKKGNRQTLNNVPNWIDKNVYDGSIFQYGVPNSILHLLNSEIDTNVTYTDIMVYLMEKLNQKLNYLEIGVSVGKNILQIASSFKNIKLTGMEIENINPILEDMFTKVDIKKWKSASTLKFSDSYLAKYSYNNNEINYLSTDEFDEQGWQQLKGEKFNAIFSDALHTPDALLFEFSMLKKYGLINEKEILILYDDLGGPMRETFLTIYEEVKKISPAVNCYQYITNGWVNIKEHHIGIITTIKL